MNDKTVALTIDGQMAAIFYAALGTAIKDTEQTLKLKSSAPFATALRMQLGMYHGYRIMLQGSFPEAQP